MDRQWITIVAIESPSSPLHIGVNDANGVIIAIVTRPFGDAGRDIAISWNHCRRAIGHQWRSLLVMWCNIGAIIGIAIGDNGSPFVPFFALGTNSVNGEVHNL